MCTGTCWVYKCSRCGGTILKDTSVSGHTCNAARQNKIRGCCRTGIEFTFYSKNSDEMCGLCEISEELNMINAESDYESCASSISGEYESCVSYVVDDDDGKDGQEEGDGENEEEEDEGGAKLSP
ncbi:uncharacterized protein F4817DRAFT_314658 [Daldinia loculata]|uniref:uncharacterized protein n=1 Tax=Daldinia loculata TaxID=103429 RepID=UPI0020C52599|nr:uncharacterized protein F4817DRAFT_314658 [Daldinia loculata]KAI1648699.1 hypothetical protein F4817DRAFT_314658 [Daldinia loculata]